MSKRPYKIGELLKKLKLYGVVALAKRGKGSEIILIKPISPGSKKGPQYPIKNHGKATEISVPVIIRILDRFNIDQNDFWG
jgi:hypothetical protein